jgi:diguanylate cyclase (GGDEF)-like protein
MADFSGGSGNSETGMQLPQLGTELNQTREALRHIFCGWRDRLRDFSFPGSEAVRLDFGSGADMPPGTYCVPLITMNGEPAAQLVYEAPAELYGLPQALMAALSVSLVQACQLEAERLMAREKDREQHLRDKEAQRHEVLFQAAKKLNDKIDVDSVLREVFESLQSVYPDVQVDLLLSQDKPATTLPVKLLSFEDPDTDICTRAFMEGRLIYAGNRQQGEAGKVTVAAPLNGKQGVYGILHIAAQDDHFDDTDIHFISMLADLAGNAFENAKLYEQSNLLITELRLINEITKRLNQSLSLSEIYCFASTELVKIFRADCCCILQADVEAGRFIVQASTDAALYHDEYPIDQGYSGIAFATGDPVIVSDYGSGHKVQSRLMEVTGSRSLIASPIQINGQVIGVIHVMHHRPNFFSYENYKLLQVLSVHVGLAMSNASLHAEVKRMVITDRLTSLYARHYLDEQVNLLQKKDFCGSLILVDIDHFKRVNDTYGHQTGDKILINVSHIIKTSIRDSDIAARWGGEELAIYLPQVARDQAARIAERIRHRVVGETNPQVTVSCGVSDWNWEDDKISVESLVYRADMALYDAKHAGRNQVKIG